MINVIPSDVCFLKAETVCRQFGYSCCGSLPLYQVVGCWEQNDVFRDDPEHTGADSIKRIAPVSVVWLAV